jgi:hypothetical protein
MNAEMGVGPKYKSRYLKLGPQIIMFVRMSLIKQEAMKTQPTTQIEGLFKKKYLQINISPGINIFLWKTNHLKFIRSMNRKYLFVNTFS